MIEHPFQVLWPLTDEEYAALKADIRDHGILVPVEVDEVGNVLDGHHRVRAWTELRAEGVRLADYQRIVRHGLTEEEKRSHARRLNLHRRHLTREQRRELIAEEIRERPEASNLQIAKDLGVSHPTVATVREDMAPATDIEKSSISVDTLGRVRPRKQPRKKVGTPGVHARGEKDQKKIEAALAHVETDELPEGVTSLFDPVIQSGLKAAKQEERAARPAPTADEPLIVPCQIEQGDSRDLPVETQSVDLIVTSPPYGLDVDYETHDDNADDWPDFTRTWLAEAYRVARFGGRLALNIPLDTTRGGFRPIYAHAVKWAEEAGWTYRSSIVWAENNINKSVARGSVDSASSPHVIAPVEMVALFSKGDWNRAISGKSDIDHEKWLEWTNGLWSFPGQSRGFEGHPAPFPEELPKRLIYLLSFPGDTVLDPFVGSGTTTLVAHRLGRKAIGFDISAEYVAMAKRRLAGA